MLRKMFVPLVSCLIVLAGCGGSGGSGVGTPVAGIPFSGKVAMPNGSAVPAGATVVDGNVIASPDANSNFNGVTQTSGIHSLSLNNNAGEVLLLGATGADGTAAVDVKHTAAIMLYYGLGLWVTPQASQAALFQDLLSQPATTTFAGVIATRLMADPLALSKNDPQILQAEKTAEDTITASTRKAARAHGTSRQSQSLQMLITPPASSPQSGLSLVPDFNQSNSNQLRFVNGFRRPVAYYIYHTEDVDAQGVHHPINPPALIKGGVEIDSTEGLNVFTTVKAVFGAPVPWIPVNGPFERLTLTDKMKQSKYSFVSVGPNWTLQSYGAPWSDPAYQGSKSQWTAELEDLNYESFINGFLLPALVAADISPTSALPKSGVKAIHEFIKSEMPEIAVVVVGANYRLALQAFVGAMATKRETAAKFAALLATETGKKLTENALAQAFKYLYKIYSVIDRAMSVGDVAKAISDLVTSNVTDSWTVTVISPTVRISPASANISSVSTSVTFSANVSGGGTGLDYIWDAGVYGTVDDHHGHVGKSIHTDQSSVTYTAKTPVPQAGTDGVTVTVFNNVTSMIGSATAGLTFTGTPSYNIQVVNLPPNQIYPDGYGFVAAYYPVPLSAVPTVIDVTCKIKDKGTLSYTKSLPVASTPIPLTQGPTTGMTLNVDPNTVSVTDVIDQNFYRNYPNYTPLPLNYGNQVIVWVTTSSWDARPYPGNNVMNAAQATVILEAAMRNFTVTVNKR